MKPKYQMIHSRPMNHTTPGDKTISAIHTAASKNTIISHPGYNSPCFCISLNSSRLFSMTIRHGRLVNWGKKTCTDLQTRFLIFLLSYFSSSFESSEKANRIKFLQHFAAKRSKQIHICSSNCILKLNIKNRELIKCVSMSNYSFCFKARGEWITCESPESRESVTCSRTCTWLPLHCSGRRRFIGGDLKIQTEKNRSIITFVSGVEAFGLPP